MDLTENKRYKNTCVEKMLQIPQKNPIWEPPNFFAFRNIIIIRPSTLYFNI